MYHFKNEIIQRWTKSYTADLDIDQSPKARIYTIVYHESPVVILIIAVSGNNNCVNVGRKHTTNDIFFSEINIEEYTYAQRCHAEMCKS